MTLLGGLFNGAPGGVMDASIENPTMPISAPGISEFIGVGSGPSGIAVSEVRAGGLPAAWRAVALLAGTVASLPLKAYQSDGPERVPVPSSHRSSVLLSEPHHDLTAFEFWEVAVSHALLWGNAYLPFVRDDLQRLTGFLITHPSQVRPWRDPKTHKKWYFVRDDNEWIVLTDNDLLHIPGIGYDGVAGISPVRAAREGFAVAIAAEEYSARMFSSGLLAGGVLRTEKNLNPEQADMLQARWASRTSGLGNAHKTVVLDNGANFERLSMPPEDAQFLESRSFQVSEIARMFGVPPHMLMDTEKSTSWGTGIEQQAIGFVTFTLRPWLTRIEQRLTRLIRPNSVYARYNIEGLLRGDAAARSAFYRTMWELGALSTNEIRALEERAPVDGGDVRYRPLNMGELGTTDPPASTTPSSGDPNAA